MHLCTAIAAQVTTLQSLKERVLACASSVQAGTASQSDVAKLQSEFLACKKALHELRLHTPEYLRVQLGIPRGTKMKEWDWEVEIDGLSGPRWRKNAEGYIEKISLGDTIIEDDGVALLPTGIKEIRLCWCQYISAPDLCKYTALKKIYLNNSTITDAGLGLLPTSVTEVNLAGCNKINAPDLRKYTKLETIDFMSSTITDAGLTFLPPGVKELDLVVCKKITRASVQELQTRLPHCNIIHNIT